jgi:hypothetical protein
LARSPVNIVSRKAVFIKEEVLDLTLGIFRYIPVEYLDAFSKTSKEFSDLNQYGLVTPHPTRLPFSEMRQNHHLSVVDIGIGTIPFSQF